MHNSQEVANAIKTYAKSKRIPVGKMLTDCELSINTLSSMQSGGYYPRLEAISKIADYLDCSVDYLLGRTDIPEVNKGNIKKIDFSSISPEELYKLIAFGGENTDTQPPIEEKTT